MRCPWCKSQVSRLHVEGEYVCIACDMCEAHGPRVKVSGQITAETEDRVKTMYKKWEDE